MHQLAAQQAGAINRGQDLSEIHVGLHSEIFQGSQPVLADVDARSAYCYLLAAAEHRDADTWGIHLQDASQQGLNPDYTIADADQGLRAGQKAAWGDKPCHGDVFRISYQCEVLANTLANIAKGAKSRRQKLQSRIGKARQRSPDLADRIDLALQSETKTHLLARDIRTLTAWLSHDVLALAGPRFPIRRDLFDYFVKDAFRNELRRVLNRGEAVNALKRAIYTGKVSPTQAKRAEEMQAEADALSLLTNIITAWNTTQMQAVRTAGPTGVRASRRSLRGKLRRRGCKASI